MRLRRAKRAKSFWVGLFDQPIRLAEFGAVIAWEMVPQAGEILSESFFHPGTGPGAAGQVVIDNCPSTEHHACGSPKERAERREERANQNDCQQEIMSRKNGASHKHHKIKQLQQIITAIRHQGETKAVNFSLFFLGGFS
jgi:hypothetical protein